MSQEIHDALISMIQDAKDAIRCRKVALYQRRRADILADYIFDMEKFISSQLPAEIAHSPTLRDLRETLDRRLYAIGDQS